MPISKYEVTQKQWVELMGNNPGNFKSCDDCPVNMVSWNDVQEFIKKLNLRTGKKYRLPTEAEWEYAAKGGKKSKKLKFSGSDNVNDVAWYYNNSENKVHPVGQKQPNELGIYDMSGNVWEWCSDLYDGNYFSSRMQDNPKGPINGTSHVLKGGSWLRPENRIYSAARIGDFPDTKDDGYGFRLALDSEKPLKPENRSNNKKSLSK